MKIERIDLLQVSIPLIHFFETSFARVDREDHIIIKIYSEGLTGYGESSVMTDPSYSYETTETVWHILKDFLLPAVVGKEINGADDLSNYIQGVRGHHFAKCGLEGGLWHLQSLREELPLYKIWGGTRNIIRSGVSIGIQDSIEELLDRVDGFLDEGYKRIKIKIKPGWDVEAVKAVRGRFDDIPLMVDANGAYSLEDVSIFKALDEFKLTMIEQPLHFADLVEHAELQNQISTPICLDESIGGFRSAQSALALESCRIINIKPGRVGGYLMARKIHDLCQKQNMPVWCGGMLEFGVGRAFNIALCSLPNFMFPGDVSSSSRYFHEDIVSPPIEFANGELEIPDVPGTGYKPDDTIIQKYTTRTFTLKS